LGYWPVFPPPAACADGNKFSVALTAQGMQRAQKKIPGRFVINKFLEAAENRITKANSVRCVNHIEERPARNCGR
jgi:hypothetical protein